MELTTILVTDAKPEPIASFTVGRGYQQKLAFQLELIAPIAKQCFGMWTQYAGESGEALSDQSGS